MNNCVDVFNRLLIYMYPVVYLKCQEEYTECSRSQVQRKEMLSQNDPTLGHYRTVIVCISLKKDVPTNPQAMINEQYLNLHGTINLTSTGHSGSDRALH